jgi:archaemetzincin
VIALVPIGNVDKDFLEALRPPLEKVFSQRMRIAGRIALPRDSWNRDRGQHLASLLLAVLSPLPSSGDRTLGVVDVDIFAPGLNFVFGQADITGRRALISLKRLRQEFYSLQRDEDLFR